MKICKKCGESKPFAGFNKKSQAKDGLRPDCRECQRAAAKIYCLQNPHKAAEWKKKNADKVNTISRRYSAKNPEERLASARKYRLKNRDLYRIYQENRRARAIKNGGELSVGLPDKLFVLQKGLCACCKKKLGNNYHLDHIMPLALGGANEDWNMQLLRQRCNNQKHMKHPVDFMRSRGFLI